MLKLVVLACLALLARGALVVPPVGTIPDKHYIPVAPPMNREARDVCIHKCLNVAPSLAGNPDKVLPCIADCIESVVASIREWVDKVPSGETVPVSARQEVMMTLYQDSVALQNKLLALRRMIETPGGAIWDFFPTFPTFPNFGNFGFGFQHPQQQGFSASTTPPAPQYPGLVVQIIQTIMNLLTQVIKKQQEILQMIIGCTCSPSNSTTTTTLAPPVTRPDTTPPPAVLVRLDAAPMVIREDVPEEPPAVDPPEPIEPVDPPILNPPPLEPIEPIQPVVVP